MCCGRNFGKTQFLVYCCVRYAGLNPNSHVYLIGPERKQEAEIVWHSKLLYNMIPVDWIADHERDVNKSELRILLRNGSFIKIDGADNPDALRGYKPHFLAADEYKDWKADSWHAMEPNLAAKKATCVIAGTPPDVKNHFVDMCEFAEREMNRGNKRYFFMKRPTHTNPHIDPVWLQEIERAYKDRGEYAIFRREYLAEFVPGGARSLIPTFSRQKHVKPLSHINMLIKKDRNSLEWFSLLDPASTSVFGALFIGYNRYQKQLFVTDEIYERDANYTSTSKMWPRIKGVESLHCKRKDRWTRICDNHEQWFINEVRDSFGEVGIIPTSKQLKEKEQQLSLIKDIFSHDLIIISEECEWFIFELENYALKANGQVPKEMDHLIDCLRYMLVFINYCLPEDPMPVSNIVIPEGAELSRSVTKDYNDWLIEKHPERAFLDEEYIDLETYLY